jgi:hypothetical protein
MIDKQLLVFLCVCLLLVVKNLQVSSVSISRNTDDSFSHPIVHINNHTEHAKQHCDQHPIKYYIIAPPQVTVDLLKNQTGRASTYYQNHLNEESVEIWLHRAFQQLSYENGHTSNPSEADVFLIAGYLHLNSAVHSVPKASRRKPAQIDHSSLIQLYQDRIVDSSKPHLMLMPAWNLNRGHVVGIKALSSALVAQKVNLWAVGLERNEVWQGIGADRIVPIPYVVRHPESNNHDDDDQFPFTRIRKNNSFFYAGDSRQNAKLWSGCFREQMILPLQTNSTMRNIDVQLVDKESRLNQSDYNQRMQNSDYCLILCGDTPSSRSLTSAMVSGCIPIRVGSRLRGMCEPPCKQGYGWRVSGRENPHLPFPSYIPWEGFPEVNEEKFMENGEDELRKVVVRFDAVKKQEIRSVMQRVWKGWIYGWGDPVKSTDFGHVHHYLMHTFQRLLLRVNESTPACGFLIPEV